jgi:hypothetical protein
MVPKENDGFKYNKQEKTCIGVLGINLKAAFCFFADSFWLVTQNFITAPHVLSLKR